MKDWNIVKNKAFFTFFDGEYFKSNFKLEEF